ncbi:ribosome-associated translation inhibitor RaiA [uncultured Lacinutrix sp.]|uniref:ribosome hibernation-promoting factor, HPF/YfiA family n=1 Tax=uncultured Lacinutrix sp. TaxID=574032 RepID=UPI002619D436|nr:ribosome-associated translation inhibitor RaiA [uncultured Lacinutrix sp.]
MKVNTQAVNFNANPELLNFVQERMNKLETYFDKVIKSDVFLKVENTTGKENKVFEARVSVPGDSFVVKKQCKSFEEGADSAIASLERQLKKRKEKLRAHL